LEFARDRSTRMKGLGLVSLRCLKRIFSAGLVLRRRASGYERVSVRDLRVAPDPSLSSSDASS
jgi:hypothetical protein